MSDTIEQAETTTDGDPNFSVKSIKVNFIGGDKEAMKFTFGAPKRTITTIDLSLGDQFDLVELAGENASNSTWMMMAGLAMSAIEIDDYPYIRPVNKSQIRERLEKIKPEGLSAYFMALKATADARPTTEKVLEAAKNF